MKSCQFLTGIFYRHRCFFHFRFFECSTHKAEDPRIILSHFTSRYKRRRLIKFPNSSVLQHREMRIRKRSRKRLNIRTYSSYATVKYASSSKTGAHLRNRGYLMHTFLRAYWILPKISYRVHLNSVEHASILEARNGDNGEYRWYGKTSSPDESAWLYCRITFLIRVFRDSRCQSRDINNNVSLFVSSFVIV